MAATFDPIAIVGYGCVFPPDSFDPEAYWHNIISGRSGIATPPPHRWDWRIYHTEDRSVDDRTYCRYGAFLDNYQFPERYGDGPDAALPSERLAKLNRTELMVLDTVLQAVGRTGYPVKWLADKTAIFVGNMLGDEQLLDMSLAARTDEVCHDIAGTAAFQALPVDERESIIDGLRNGMLAQFPDPEKVSADSAMQSDLAGAVARLLGISGQAVVADAACASGLSILDVAVKYLQDGTYRTVIATGVLGNMSVTGNVCFAKIGGLSATHSSPLDRGADGLIPGEGAGTVLLKRLADATRDGDQIYGVIRGVATRSDGKGKAIYAPSPQGQVAAMRRALELAGVAPEELDYVETHATSTPTGDVVEISSLREIFDGRPVKPRSVAIGSVKAQIGHTFSAAGMANLIKILEGFRRETLPPTHGFTTPPPAMHLEDSPFYVVTQPAPWGRTPFRPRRALSNAFGFGGVNTSIVVEQYEPVWHRHDHMPAATGAGPAEPLAVVGVGCITPYARSLAEVAPDRLPGEGVTGFPAGRWHPASAALHDPDGSWRGAVITELDFPWKKYRVPPNVLDQIDRAQLMAVMAAGCAIDDWGGSPEQRRDTSIFLGAVSGLESALLRNYRIRLVEYTEALAGVASFRRLDSAARAEIVSSYTERINAYTSPTREDALPGYMDNVTAGRIANLFDLRGPAMAVDEDVCSFPAALGIAARYLARGECAAALVGGLHANLAPEFTRLYQRRLAAAGQPVEGFVPGEAAVFFVVKPISAVTSQERVHAVVHPATQATVREPVAVPGRPFYFGAEAAVRLLDAVAALRADPSRGVWLETAALYGQGYRYAVSSVGAGLPADGPVPLGSDESTMEPQPEPEPRPALASGVAFAAGGTVDELIGQLNRLASGQAQPLDRLAKADRARFRIGFTYGAPEELASKAQLAARLLAGVATGSALEPLAHLADRRISMTTRTVPATAAQTAPRPVTASLRLGFFWPVLVFSISCTVPLYLLSGSTDDYFAWQTGSPLTAATLGAGYAAAVTMISLTLLERDWVNARATLFAPVVLLGVMLVATVTHWDMFPFGGSDTGSSTFAWFWLSVHLLAPVLALSVWLRQRREPGLDGPPQAPMGPDVTIPTSIMGVVLVGLAVPLWFAPDTMADHWAWPVKTLDARALAAWLFTFGVASFQAAWERDVRRLKAGFFTDVTLSALGLIGLARYSDDVRWGSAFTWLYLVTLVCLLVAGLTGRFLALPEALKHSGEH